MSAKVEVNNSKQSLIAGVKKNKSLFLLIICGLILVAIVSLVKAGIFFTKIPDVTPTNLHPNCKIGGCNSELCVDKNSEEVMSICMYSDDFACLKQDICTIQKDGKCGWSNTEKYQKCIKELQPSLNSKDIPVM